MIKSFNIPNEHIAELIEVFGQNWQETVDGNPNPETKAQFASRKFDEEVMNYVKRRVIDYRKVQLMKSINSATIIETA